MAAKRNNAGTPAAKSADSAAASEVSSQPATHERDFVITRVINAPRELVFEAWTNPKHLAQWWGPRVFTTPVCEVDARPGGAYRIVMRYHDDVDYPMQGVYHEIVAPERIVMTMDCTAHPAEWHDLVKPNRSPEERNPAGVMLTTATFEDVDGQTKLTVRVRLDSAAIREAMVKMGMNEGWSQSLERLGEFVAKK